MEAIADASILWILNQNGDRNFGSRSKKPLMHSFVLPILATSNAPAIGLVPSLFLAALGLAIIVVIVVRLMRESDDGDRNSLGADEQPAPDDAESSASESEAEHTGDDVV
ncbi:MAG: hypothetical protein ABEK29_11285 [Bradymonadaceae bacterium]